MNARMMGWMLLAVPVLLQVPYTWLVMNYGYPGILREDASVVLTRFAAGGMGMVVAWYGYAVSIAPLLFVMPELGKVLTGRRAGLAAKIGFASALVQVVALLRWVFVVPLLAQAWVGGPESGHGALRWVYVAQHQLLGTMLGEHVGQALLAAWTLLVVVDRPDWWWMRWLGVGAAAGFVAGLAGHWAPVWPALAMWEPATTVGFLLWSVWTVSLGVMLVRSGGKPVG